MKKRLEVQIPEELLSTIRQAAKQNKITVSKYVEDVLANQLPLPTPVLDITPITSDDISIELHGEEASMLRIRAKKLGMSPTAFIRKKILFEDMKEIYITLSVDEDDLINLYSEYKNDVRKCLLLIAEKDYLDEYSKELSIISNQLNELIHLTKEHATQLYKIKESIKRKAYRKILEEINNGN